MKNKKNIVDFLLGITAIVMILFSVKNVVFNPKTNESTKKQAGSLPAQLNFSTKNFQVQDASNLLLTSAPSVNKQFDYTVEGEAAGTTTFFPILFTQSGSAPRNVVYCADIEKYVPVSTNDYTKGNAMSAAISYIIENGAKGLEGNLTKDDELDYYATQIAVYSHTNSDRMQDPSQTYDNLTGTALTRVSNKITSLVNGSKTATYSSTLTSTGDKTLTKVEGQNYYESGLITVTATKTNPQITLSTSFTGAQLLDENGSSLSQPVASGTKFKIRIPEANLSDGNNNITVSAAITATVKKAYEYTTTATTNNQPVILTDLEDEATTGNGNIAFTANKPAPEPTYSITVEKRDQANAHLSGATLVLKKGGVLVGAWTSNGASHTFNNLTAGNYTIEETVVPTGYTGASAKSFTLPGGENQTYTMVNTKVADKGSIKITKTFEGGTLQAGAKFEVRSGSNVVGSWTSTGTVNTHTFNDLPVGTYTVVETTAPAGFKVAASQNVTVTANNTSNATFNNVKTSITVIKHDESNKPLAGAELEIINSQGTVVYNWTTDATGTATFKGIPVGTYNVREKTAPTGYAKTDTLFPFTITNNSDTSDVIVKNYKVVVKINKLDAKSKEHVPGANLVVKASDGTQIKSYITNGSTYELYDLAPGTYTIEETKAPDGYAINENKVTFTVSDTSKVVDVEFLNNKLVVVPPTAFNISKILFMIGFAFTLIGGAFIYFYVKNPQTEQ